MLAKDDPELQAIFNQYPGYSVVPAPTFPAFGPRPAGDPPSTQQLIADGWGYVTINPASIQADNGAGLTRGIIGLVNKGQPRKPEDWGALRAWEWGAAPRVSTISKPIQPSMRNTSASKAYRATARPHW